MNIKYELKRDFTFCEKETERYKICNDEEENIRRRIDELKKEIQMTAVNRDLANIV